MKAWLGKWLMDAIVAANARTTRRSLPGLAEMASGEFDDEGLLRLTLIKATNGRILKLSRYNPNARGNDWTHTLYLITKDESVPEVITRALVTNALED